MQKENIFGTRIRLLRAARKETQRTLAELLGVSVTQISDMEKGLE